MLRWLRTLFVPVKSAESTLFEPPIVIKSVEKNITRNVRTLPEPKPTYEIKEEWIPIIAAFQRGENIFITGQAGTGKSTLISHLRGLTTRKIVMLAPTGIAALNICGQTIHSFCQFPPEVITKKHIKSNKLNRGKAQACDIIIIDEISMVRCDLLGGTDHFMRRNGKDPKKPFGGVQIILVGDPLQLPPVVNKVDERLMLKIGYKQFFFWGCTGWQHSAPVVFELTTVYRQAEIDFSEILGRIRKGNINNSDIETLNSCVDEGFKTSDNPFYITVTCFCSLAFAINSNSLYNHPGDVVSYSARLEGSFAKITVEENLPFERNLMLKIGVPVMFNKNSKAWMNGEIGKIIELHNDRVVVELHGDTVTVRRVVWGDVRYRINERTGELEEQEVGKAEQFPLVLAWAVTIHKSQGLSFDRINVDFKGGAFSSGQAYVALSRCRTLSGLKLAMPFYPNNIITDPEAVAFMAGVTGQTNGVQVISSTTNTGG